MARRTTIIPDGAVTITRASEYFTRNGLQYAAWTTLSQTLRIDANALRRRLDAAGVDKVAGVYDPERFDVRPGHWAWCYALRDAWRVSKDLLSGAYPSAQDGNVLLVDGEVALTRSGWNRRLWLGRKGRSGGGLKQKLAASGAIGTLAVNEARSGLDEYFRTSDVRRALAEIDITSNHTIAWVEGECMFFGEIYSSEPLIERSIWKFHDRESLREVTLEHIHRALDTNRVHRRIVMDEAGTLIAVFPLQLVMTTLLDRPDEFERHRQRIEGETHVQ